MKFVLLSADGIEHRHVVSSIDQVLGESLVSIIIEDNSSTSLRHEVRRIFRKYSLLVVLERITTKAMHKLLRTNKKLNCALEQVLGEKQSLKHSALQSKLYTTKSIRSQACYQHIANIEPDYIFVYGTGIVPDNILNLSKKQSFNLHTGISPFYRGSSTAFWPLFYDDTNMVGATVHVCTSEIDGGSIALRASAKLDENDNVHTAFAKAVLVGSKIYSKLASKLANNEIVPLEPQDFSIGKEYKFSDRTFIQELKMEFRYKSGSIAKAITRNNLQEPPFQDS